MTFAQIILFLVIGAAAICFYLLPALIADIRDTKHGWTILVLNLLLGWTVLGWIALVIWACVEKKAPEA